MVRILNNFNNFGLYNLVGGHMDQNVDIPWNRKMPQKQNL